MATEARIVLHAPDSASAESAAKAAFARIAELDRMLSDYQPTSELTRLSAASGGPPVNVSDDLFRVLSRALEVARETDGAFDPTAGPLTLLWRGARRDGRLPEREALEDARRRTGWRLVTLDSAARTVRLVVAGMRLDLGGIAKGFAVDEALAVLRARGLERAMVVLGGDIAVGRAPPGQPGWRVEVARSGAGPRALVLENEAVSTSGDTEQYLELDGVRYSHVLDPRTGLGLTHRLAVTVVAPSGMDADAFATAVAALGPEARARFRGPGTRFHIWPIQP